MAQFNPSMIVPLAKSAEFAGGDNKRTAKHVLLDGIAKQIELFKKPTSEGRRWFTVGKTEVALSLRVNNQPLKIMGDDTKVAVPAAHFEDAMLHFKGEVEKGAFDKQLEEADKGMMARREKIKQTRAAKKKPA